MHEDPARSLAIEAAPHGGFVVMKPFPGNGWTSQLLFAGSLPDCLGFAAKHFRPPGTVKPSVEPDCKCLASGQCDFPACLDKADPAPKHRLVEEWVIKAVRPSLAAGKFLKDKVAWPTEFTSEWQDATVFQTDVDAAAWISRFALIKDHYEIVRLIR